MTSWKHSIACALHDGDPCSCKELRSVSYGGGVQSTALLVLAARRERSIPLPVRMGAGGAPGNRTCTLDFKIRVIAKELKRRGATDDWPATVAIGFSVDEIGRVKPSREPLEVFEHPLIDRGMSRADCMRLIADEGLEVPQRSSCFFCPFHTLDEWRNIRRETPELFDRSVALEREMHERGKRLGRGQFYFTRFGRFLDEVVHDQGVLFDRDETADACDSGACWT